MGRNYVICTTQRSGSSYLCERLSHAKQLGKPEEYFVFLEYRAEALGQEERALASQPLEHILRQRRAQRLQPGTQGLFGLKLMCSTMRNIRARAGGETLSNVGLGALIARELDDPVYIFFERHDKLAQAISHAILQITKVSHAHTPEQLASLETAKAEIKLSGSEISLNLKRVLEDEAQWERFFEDNDIHPLRIDYDELCVSPKATVEKIAKYVGVDPGSLRPPSEDQHLLKTRSQVELTIARKYLWQLVRVINAQNEFNGKMS